MNNIIYSFSAFIGTVVKLHYYILIQSVVQKCSGGTIKVDETQLEPW